MNKAQLSARVAPQTPPSKAGADAAVSAVFSSIADALASNETVRIAGFANFSTRSRPLRQGRNPHTSYSMAITASNTPSFKAGKILRNAVN